VYHAVKEQTDDTPLITADGSVINPNNPQKWIAVSRDLEKLFPMGSKLYIDCNCKHTGVWIVRDRMNARWTKRIDFLTHPSLGMGIWKNVKIKPYAIKAERS
jgi:3D (Asp-Asp-Asp) domain-containing protein